MIIFYTSFIYHLGSEKFEKTDEINQLHETIKQKDLQLETLNRALEQEKSNVKIMTKYKTNVVTVEKEIPIYENKIQTIFKDNPNPIIPDDVARLHDEIVCSTSTNYQSPCGTSYQTKTPITLKQFSTAVANNYQICKANSEQLISLQEWARNQETIKIASSTN